MTAFFRNSAALWLGVLAIVIYPPLHFLLGAEVAKLILDSLVLGVAVVISWSWSSAAWEAASNGGRDASDRILLTIWLAWTTLAIQRIYVITVTALGRPDWLTSSIWPGEITTLIFVAGMYAIFAPVTGDKVPRREIINTIIAVAIGSAMAGASAAIAMLRTFGG